MRKAHCHLNRIEPSKLSLAPTASINCKSWNYMLHITKNVIRLLLVKHKTFVKAILLMTGFFFSEEWNQLTSVRHIYFRASKLFTVFPPVIDDNL